MLLSVHMVGMAINDVDKTGSIKGIVVDARSGVPIEYATVAVYDAENKVVTGTVSDVNGSFRIVGLNWGVYHVQLSFMGYDSQRVSNLSIASDKASHNLGMIKLSANTETLNEVEVVAERKAFEYKIDKKIVNVSGQATAASMTAVEVLENVPSVKVDVEGNVSLRGSGGFTVLIDGKPTILDASDALRQLPASAIENIEIITNPSVKYQPDGTAGIINVITKKNKSLGVNGQAGANVGMYGTYGGDLLLNYRHKKINYILGADFNHRVFPGESESERRTEQMNETITLFSQGSAEREMQMWGIRGGLEFDINPKNSATISGRFGDRNMEMNSPLDYQRYSSLGTSSFYTSNDMSTRSGNFYSVTGTYLRQFAKKGHQLSSQFDFSNRSAKEESTNELVQATTLQERRRNLENGPGQRAEVKLEYTLPFSETNKLEAGYQGRWEEQNDESSLENWNLGTQQWEVDDLYVKTSDEKQQIHALYTMYAGMLNKFGYQAGLRGEYNLRSITTDSPNIINADNEEFNLDRLDFFPTIHFSYQLPLDQQIMTSYSRRVQRTQGWMLEPFITWQNAYSVRMGNPDLEPQFIDSYELGYVKQFKQAYISFEAYHRVTHNKVEYLQRNWEVQEGVLMSQPFNVGKDYSTGLELSINLKQLKWWEINLMGNIYNYEVTGKALNKDFSNTTFNWGGRMNNTFRFVKNHQLQFNGNFNSPTATAQGEVRGYYSFDAAYRMDMMKRKLSAVLQARDLFKTGERVSTSQGDGFYTYSKWGMKAPLISLSVIYRFNNYMPKRQNNRPSGGDDMNGDEGGEF